MFGVQEETEAATNSKQKDPQVRCVSLIKLVIIVTQLIFSVFFLGLFEN